jgi:hypothetical protein
MNPEFNSDYLIQSAYNIAYNRTLRLFAGDFPTMTFEDAKCLFHTLNDRRISRNKYHHLDKTSFHAKISGSLTLVKPNETYLFPFLTAAALIFYNQFVSNLPNKKNPPAKNQWRKSKKKYRRRHPRTKNKRNVRTEARDRST